MSKPKPMSDARLAMLRGYATVADGAVGEKMREAVAEIDRLKTGGCARGDQHTTQHCAEAAALAAENKRMKEALDAYECWMRDVINTDACWPNGPQGTPTLTPALYERFLLIRPTGKTFGESEPKA